jgi:hypothetical protein
MFPVYETRRCDDKTLLEAGNNTMAIDCAGAFKETKRRGNISKMNSLQDIVSFLGEWANTWGLTKFNKQGNSTWWNEKIFPDP